MLLLVRSFKIKRFKIQGSNFVKFALLYGLLLLSNLLYYQIMTFAILSS
jgi:hypothetical protein